MSFLFSGYNQEYNREPSLSKFETALNLLQFCCLVKILGCPVYWESAETYCLNYLIRVIK